MSTNLIGAFVTHAKLLELGSGEVLAAEKGTLRVRFSSGERLFLAASVQPHLTVTVERPAPTPVATRASKKKKAAKPAA